MATPETGVDAEFRQRVADTMISTLARLLERAEPVTEDMRLMEELGLSSTLALELLLECEEQLDIFIDVEQIDQGQMASVGDLALFVASNSRPS